MQRLHLIEFEDLPWVPAAIRDGATAQLDLMFARVGFYRALAPKLAALLDATGRDTVVDLCSGAGGGALAMRAALRSLGARDVALVLTDRYPNAAARDRVAALGDPGVRYHPDAVDAREVPRGLDGVRTMYGALHHFRPDEVTEILRRAVEADAPVAFFDVAASPTLRRLPTALAPVAALPNAAALFALSWALGGMVRPLRATSALWTWGLPAIPAMFAWDGTVSALRAYLPEELLALARRADARGRYQWAVDRAGGALSLIGRPPPTG